MRISTINMLIFYGLLYKYIKICRGFSYTHKFIHSNTSHTHVVYATRDANCVRFIHCFCVRMCAIGAHLCSSNSQDTYIHIYVRVSNTLSALMILIDADADADVDADGSASGIYIPDVPFITLLLFLLLLSSHLHVICFH